MLGKRTRSKVDGLNESDKPSKEYERKKQKTYDKIKFQPGDAVSVSSKIFDGDNPGSYSKDNPDRQKGTIIKIFKERRVAQVEWIDG